MVLMSGRWLCRPRRRRAPAYTLSAGGVVVLEFDRVGLLLDVASGLLGAGPAGLDLSHPLMAVHSPAGAIGRELVACSVPARVRRCWSSRRGCPPLVVVVHAEVANSRVVRQIR